MVNTNTYIENKWSSPTQRSVAYSNKWHQSQNPGSNTHNRSQTEFVQRQIKRNSETIIGNQIRHISKECNDMLKKKLEEIRVHNNKLAQKKAMVEIQELHLLQMKTEGTHSKKLPHRRKTQ